MILLFLPSLVFSTDIFDTHPAIMELHNEFGAERAYLKQIFGRDSKLLQTCLDTINGKSGSVFHKFQEIQKTYPVDKKLVFSQGYRASSAYELFCSICLLAVHPAANNFFVPFDVAYEQTFKNRPLSPSLLMLLSVLTKNPVQVLQSLGEIIADISVEEDDAITMFGIFYSKCNRRFGPESLLVQYMGDEEEEEEGTAAAEAARRLMIESKIIRHVQVLTSAQADPVE